jgi:hypothetical protein
MSGKITQGQDALGKINANQQVIYDPLSLINFRYRGLEKMVLGRPVFPLICL